MRGTKTVGYTVEEYLKKYPTLSSRKLAALIFSEVQGIFKSMESARDAVRYYRGANGDANRHKLHPDSYHPKVTMPEPDEEDYTPYQLDASAYPIIAGGDAHIPYHDQDALEIFTERAVAIGAKTIVLMGDWIDFHAMSKFIRDPRKRNTIEEIKALREILGIFKAAAPKAKIIYKIGNHEERYDAYIMQHAPELYHLATCHFDSAIGAKELGIEVVQNKRIVRAGHLNMIHGHEYTFAISNPVSPARGLYLRAGANAICWHFHKKSEHSNRNMNGKRTGTWSVGCLCGLTPQYAPLNDWGHGFAEIYQEDDDYFRVENKGIINYRIV